MFLPFLSEPCKAGSQDLSDTASHDFLFIYASCKHRYYTLEFDKKQFVIFSIILSFFVNNLEIFPKERSLTKNGCHSIIIILMR